MLIDIIKHKFQRKVKQSLFDITNLSELVTYLKFHNGKYQTEICNSEDISKMSIIVSFHVDDDNFISTFDVFHSKLSIKYEE